MGLALTLNLSLLSSYVSLLSFSLTDLQLLLQLRHLSFQTGCLVSCRLLLLSHLHMSNI